MDLTNIPNVFGIRDYIASKIIKQSIFWRIRENIWKWLSSLASVFSVKKQENNVIINNSTNKIQETKKQEIQQETKIEDLQFFDFTKDDLGIQKETEKKIDIGGQFVLPSVSSTNLNTNQQFATKSLQTA